jgi:hypothetical protein
VGAVARVGKRPCKSGTRWQTWPRGANSADYSRASGTGTGDVSNHARPVHSPAEFSSARPSLIAIGLENRHDAGQTIGCGHVSAGQ